MIKKRIDLLLVKKKLVETRNKAQYMISSGLVFINNKKVLKNGETYDESEKIILKNDSPIWVSRAAIKLLHALEYFKINVNNYLCLDIGASTGGFTEVLLSKNIKKIYCVDVGTNQLHKSLLFNSKIVNLPQTNAKFINEIIIPDLLDLIVCDVSFVSMKKVIEPSIKLLKDSGIIIGLIKPQFESEKKDLSKRGIIKDPEIHMKICSDYRDWFERKCKLSVIDIIPSPIKGQMGNIEFLIFAKKL